LPPCSNKFDLQTIRTRTSWHVPDHRFGATLMASKPALNAG
jgi:hypothetical protein